MKCKRIALISIPVFLFTLSTLAYAVPYTARLLHPAGYTLSAAVGVFGGSQAGWGWGNVDSNFFLHALLWNGSAESVTDLHPASGYDFTQAKAFSGDIQVGVGGVGNTSRHALMWRGTAASLVDLHPPTGFTNTEATGASGTTQVGFGRGAATGHNDHALMWNGTAASVIDLTPPGIFETRAFGASAGSQIGYGSTKSTGVGIHALLWHGTAASVVDLDPLGAVYEGSYGFGVDTNYQVGAALKIAANPNENSYHAFLLNGTAASGIDLNPAGMIESYAMGVAGGSQVGYARSTAGGNYHAFLWQGTAASAVDLHASLAGLGPTFVQSQALAINEYGDIVGGASDATGRLYAILWTVPEPSTAAPLGCALFALVTRRCQTRPIP